MADVDINALGDQLAGLTLKQAVELAGYLEEKHGIKAAAAAVVSGGGGGGGGGAAAAAPAEEIKSTFDVVLKAGGDKKIQVIKVVREATGLGLAEAKAFVDAPGKAIKTGLTKEEADKLAATLKENGATVEIV